jgi:hypothetical protein
MKEADIIALPVPIGDDQEIEIFDYKGGICMTTEFLGKCLGYANPQDGMAKLFERNKAVLEGHRFPVTVTGNPQGGRPSFFYDEAGILKCILLAGTSVSKGFGPRMIDRLQTLHLQYRSQINERVLELQCKLIAIYEHKLKARTSLSNEEREMVRQLNKDGVGVNEIARRLGRSKGGISNFLIYGSTSGRIIKK